MLFEREPAMVLATVMAAIALAVEFGLSLSGSQSVAIEVFAALVLGLVTRSKVTPVSQINQDSV